MKKLTLFIITLLTLALAPTCADAQALRGDATYYGNRWHGRRTSSGELYNKDSLTCAHRTLPFGTVLRVRNTRNNKEVLVRVIDRGPFRKGAIVDLSMAAAKEIDMVGAGVVPVVAEVVEDGSGMRVKEFKAYPDLQLIDVKSGALYNAADYAQAQHEERASQLRTAAIKAKAIAPYHVLLQQQRMARAQYKRR